MRAGERTLEQKETHAEDGVEDEPTTVSRVDDLRVSVVDVLAGSEANG